MATNPKTPGASFNPGHPDADPRGSLREGADDSQSRAAMRVAELRGNFAGGDFGSRRHRVVVIFSRRGFGRLFEDDAFDSLKILVGIGRNAIRNRDVVGRDHLGVELRVASTFRMRSNPGSGTRRKLRGQCLDGVKLNRLRGLWLGLRLHGGLAVFKLQELGGVIRHL